MSTCLSCGKNLGFLNKAGNGLCITCASSNEVRQQEYRKDASRQTERNESVKSYDPKIVDILLTTETVSSLNIVKRIEIVTAEVAFGMNIFRDLFAGVRNVVGGRSEAVQKTMRDSRRTALYELKKEAYEVGANAVVGVDLDYVELAGTGSNMVMLVASGTAVVIEE